MTPLGSEAVLTAAEMRAAEAAEMAGGTSVDTLMARAGNAVAEQVRRLAAGAEVLVLCGPGNNGGDGYLAATALASAGLPVRVAAPGEPTSDAARAARRDWTASVEPLADTQPAPVLVDALFGTGLSRGLAPSVADRLARFAESARLSIAVDLPSGIATDDGALLSPVPRFDLTLALGALKPAHVLLPGADRCGAVRVLDIGVPATSDVGVLDRPHLLPPPTDAHKYTRGMVALVAGAMPGASALAATAATHAGAGYVLLLGGTTDRVPHAIVRRRYDPASLDDARIGALLVGPGLGRDDAARAKLTAALATDRPLVLDGDALHLVEPATLAAREAPVILTPHAGEFAALFGSGDGSKIERARRAAQTSGAIVVFKGADTVIADASGQVRVATNTTSWLSAAGTGDVLAGTIAARLAADRDPFAAACTGVWLHGAAARLAGPAFAVDDLPRYLSRAIARCL